MVPDDIKPGEIRTTHAEIGGPLVEVLAKDYGQHLIHGQLGKPGELTAFEMNAPTLQIKRAIGAAVNQKQNRDRPGIAFCYALANSVRSIGGVSVCQPTRQALLYGAEGKESVGEVALRIARLPVGDVMRLVIAQHATATKGGKIRIAADACEACESRIGTVEVAIAEETPLRVLRPQVCAAEPPRGWVGLHDGIELEDGRVVRAVQIAPPTWHAALWQATAKQFAEPVSLVAIMHAAAIVDTDLEGVSSVSTQDLEFSLSEEDADLLDEATGQVAPAPVFLVGVTCPQCGHVNREPINWMNLDFLRRASAG